jgi:NitT/TauT family transport system substrate-binding protein
MAQPPYVWISITGKALTRQASIVLAALISITQVSSAQTAIEKASLRLDWLPSGYHAPYFLGLERGYYRARGVDLLISDGRGSTSTIQTTAGGGDTFGLANLSAMALAVSRGVPLVAIGGLIQKDPNSVISLAGSGIKNPKDVEGRRGGFVPDGAGERLFPAFAKMAGIDVDKIIKLQITSSARYSILLQSNADFVVGWTFTDAYKISKQKPISQPLLFSDFGLNMLANGMIASKETLANRGKVVRAFLEASVQGIEETIKDPSAAVDAMLRARPDSDRDVLLEGAKSLSNFLRTSRGATKPIGWMSAEDWDDTLKILTGYLGMSGSVPSQSLYTNDYLPKS